jgi:two-component system, chemotaxis family, sensor kinase CheA
VRELAERVEDCVSADAASAPPSSTVAVPGRMEEQVITEADAPLACQFVNEAIGHLDAAEASLLKLADTPDNLDEVNAVFRAFHTIKGVAGFLNLRQVGALAHVAETFLDAARKGRTRLSGKRLDVVLEALDLMKRMVAAVEVAAKNGRAPALQDGVPNLVRRLEAAAVESGAANPIGSPDDAAPMATAAAPSALPAAEESIRSTAAPASSPPREESAAPAGDATVKVATDRLDALINSVGELVISQAMVFQDLGGAALAANQRLARNLSHLEKITRTLQDLALAMRMVPIHGVFQKLTRLAHDLSRKGQKQIEFNAVGSETEVDRNLIEAIGDPLVHMVRNAIDHGIESAPNRTTAGKDPIGHIELKAWQQAGNIVIQLSDDGKGLDKQKILGKALEAGIVPPDSHLSDQEIFRLIFQPGLSTAEKVTDISGRGVGMDVVLKNVERLRGRIEIDSIDGRGTTFTLRLPLTLAVIDGLIVAVGGHRYIVPLVNIDTSCQVCPEQISTIQGSAQLCRSRGQLLPLFHLHRLFAVENAVEDPIKGLIVVVEDAQRKCCLLVDAIVGQQQVVIKSLGESLGTVRGVSGGAILGDGTVSLILDVPGIIDLAREPSKHVA